MAYWAYTILKSSNPELISSESTFVKKSPSELLKNVDGESHFTSWKNTMDEEIIKLSEQYPEETFFAECHWGNEIYYRIIYDFEYKNGSCKELGIKPGYLFFFRDKKLPCQEECSTFKKHVLKYFERLDIVKEDDACSELDILGIEKNQYGYKSNITITYENDIYIWTCTKVGISCLEVSVEKRNH